MVAYLKSSRRCNLLFFNFNLLGVPTIVNKNKEVEGRIVEVTWEPPLEGACPVVRYTVHYREVILPPGTSTWTSVNINRNATSYTLHLNCMKEYEIAVTSFNAHRESVLNDSQIWKFKTGGGKFIRKVTF